MAMGLKTVFEKEAGTRCGGSGHYSFCTMYGTRCFKCGGRGETFTKRSAAAATFYRGLCSLPVKEIEPGMQVWYEGLQCPGAVMEASEWKTVESVESEPVARGSYNGEPCMTLEVFMTSEKHEPKRLAYHAGVSHSFRVRQTPEQAAEKQAQALAYQATLTKFGKPRKTKEAT